MFVSLPCPRPFASNSVWASPFLGWKFGEEVEVDVDVVVEVDSWLRLEVPVFRKRSTREVRRRNERARMALLRALS
jgi:hypothetical protein